MNKDALADHVKSLNSYQIEMLRQFLKKLPSKPNLVTDEQKAHAAYVGDRAQMLIIEKYLKGAKEHGGNIWDLSFRSLLENGLEEALDQVVFILTLLDKYDEQV